jgi:hypothetical protein
VTQETNMIFSRQNNREISRRQHERDDLVDVNHPSIEGYRLSKWDPYDLRHDIERASLEASSQGDHIWTSSESIQMEAGSTWLAMARKSIGHGLIDYAAKDGKIPQDVATAACANYEIADGWVQYREKVRAAGDDYSLDIDPSVIAPSWPQPNMASPISRELLSAAYQTAGLMVVMYLPAVLETLSSSLPYPPEYRGYDKETTTKLRTIQQKIELIDMYWSDSLDPNVPPGDRIYREVIEVLEEITLFGAESLVPVVGNPFYKLAKKPKPAAAIDSNAFDPAAARPPREIAQVSTPAFDPSTLRARTTDASAPTTPVATGEPFDPSRFHGTSAPTEQPAPLEAFRPAAYISRYLGAHAVTAFDPTAHLGHAASPNKSEPFDPTKYGPK